MVNRKKIGVLSSIIFIVIEGIGMYIAKNVFSYDYSDPNILRFSLYVQMILVGFCLFIMKKYYSYKEIGFNKLNKKQVLWLFPHSCLIIGILVMALSNGTIPEENGYSLIFTIILATLFVGIAEEIMFRGIVLHSFLEGNKIFKPMIISAILFSLLHSVNIFAGVSITSMIMQLILTFIFGLFAAAVAIKLNNLIPLILYHFLWDMSLFVSDSLGISPSLGSFGVLISLILIIILWTSLFITEKKKRV